MKLSFPGTEHKWLRGARREDKGQCSDFTAVLIRHDPVMFPKLPLILFVASLSSRATQTPTAPPTAPNATSASKPADVMAILEMRVLSEMDLDGMPTQAFLDKLYEVFRMESNVTFVLTIKSMTEI